MLCWNHISQIYEDNLADINSLIFVKDDFRKFLACVAHQLSLHSMEGMPPRPVHAPKTKIRLLGRSWCQNKNGDSSSVITKEMIREVQEDRGMTLEMDSLFVTLPTMDKTLYYLEFFHRSDGGSGASSSAPWARNSSQCSINGEEEGQPMCFAPSCLTCNDIDVSSTVGGGKEEVTPQKNSPDPPTFDDVVNSEEWVGIDDVLASGDIDELLTALMD